MKDRLLNLAGPVVSLLVFEKQSWPLFEVSDFVLCEGDEGSCCSRTRWRIRLCCVLNLRPASDFYLTQGYGENIVVQDVLCVAIA